MANEKKYVKNGKVRTLNAISIVVNDKRYIGITEALAKQLGFNNVDELLASCGWQVYEDGNLTQTLENAIAAKIAEIQSYGTSSEVDSFYVNGEEVWLGKGDRVGLKNLLQVQEKEGQEHATIWLNNKVYTLVPIAKAIAILDKVELYAYDCYNVTQSHIADAKECKSIAEVEQIDVTADYPAKLQFTIE